MNHVVIHWIDINPANIAINTDHGWQTSRQVKVGCAVFHAKRQQLSDIHYSP
jgi:hypothetical protein